IEIDQRILADGAGVVDDDNFARAFYRSQQARSDLAFPIRRRQIDRDVVDTVQWSRCPRQVVDAVALGQKQFGGGEADAAAGAGDDQNALHALLQKWAADRAKRPCRIWVK